MIPKPPPREGSLGFLYLPPYRVQGQSVAGEAVCVQIPELDICFDMGTCPRPMLASKFVALSHGHMDHTGALAYYCSQRRFQGMGVGTIICDHRIADDVRAMLEGFSQLERQKTPYELIEAIPDQDIRIKNNITMRSFEVEHTAPAVAYNIIEHRSKLRDEFVGLPQDKLRELKHRGTEITHILEIPLITYIGDTAPGPWLVRPEVLNSRIVICECTFFEHDHKDRAKIGQHLHVQDIVEWLGVLKCEHLILHHISRRTNTAQARQRLDELASPENARRVHLLMDHRNNRARYDQQFEEAEALEHARLASS